jgi:FtsP/CotA-like multicopper oxidase with cupredoxin domain
MGAPASGTDAGLRHEEPPLVQPNPNTARAGVLRDGTLSVALEASEDHWHANGTERPPVTIAAFHEPGKPPLMPGPLVRARAGTTIQFSIRNSLAKPLTFMLPSALRGATAQMPEIDSLLIAPGAVGTITARAAAPGNFIYRASVPGRADAFFGATGLLSGAIVIDSAGAPARARDRVLVLMETPDSAFEVCADVPNRAAPPTACPSNRLIYTINGRSWPNTEREHATVGDSLHWRIINDSYDTHPMHLHGYYYRVDEFRARPNAPEEPPAVGQMVVTQAMSPFSTMSMTWSPTRAGNWLFHCHFAVHLQPDSLSAVADDRYLRDMSGLVIGTIVSPLPGIVAASRPLPARQLRLVASSDGSPSSERPYELGTPQSVPPMFFVLEENGQRIKAGPDFSPDLELVRGEPVAITIVNHLALPTSVHWHGIEVEDSYMDGVPGFSGSGSHLSPMIAPGDSFVARFTPPRAGTFMYHAHMDEMREDMAGLEGALIVREPGAVRSPDDHVIFLKGAARDATHPLEIDGQANPDTIVLHAGRVARFRIINLSTFNPAAQFWLTARPDSAPRLNADSMLVHWRVVAKDGFDSPAAQRIPELARRVVSIGETYDFEYTPEHPGTRRLEVRGSGPAHPLLIRVPIRVE